MRYKDFKLTEEELLEINMSPGNLAKLASNIDARVGLEFEMLVPDVESGDDIELEPDFDYDRHIDFNNFTDDVTTFFTDGENAMDRRTVQKSIAQFEEGYFDWVTEQDIDSSPEFQQWLRDEIWVDKKEFYLEKAKELFPVISAHNLRIKAYALASNDAAEAIEEHNDLYFEYLDEFRNSGTTYEIFDLKTYCEENDINTMHDLTEHADFQWPYYRPVSNKATSIKHVAAEFEDAIKRPVDFTTTYHGKAKSDTAYTVEPDSSLEGDDGDAGLEFVSPPLSIKDIMQDFPRVVKWARSVGAYTNESCGLHMNVSVPNYSTENLDYVKLVLLLGDDYVAQLFDRLGNSYAKSATEKIKFNVNPESLPNVFNTMKTQFNHIASKSLIHAAQTDKYTSVNIKDNRIELRSPGGDWLSRFEQDSGVFLNTLLRTVVALDAALDPDKYRKEYLTKLYKLLSAEQSTTLQLFAKYTAGLLNTEQLKTQWARLVLQQKAKQSNREEEYDVYNINTGKRIASGAGPVDTLIDYTARSKGLENSMLKAVPKGQPMDYRYPNKKPKDATALASKIAGRTPIRGVWNVVDRKTGKVIDTFSGLGNQKADANRALYRWAQTQGVNVNDFTVQYE